MRYRFFLTLSVIVLSTVSRAQTPPSQSTPSTVNVPPVITLDDAIHAAMARNYTVRIESNQARIDSIEVTRAKDNMWLPSASATASYGYDYSLAPVSERQYYVPTAVQVPITDSTGKVIGYVPSETTNPAYAQAATTPAGSNSLSYNVGASFNLFNGWQDISRIHAAEATRGAGGNTAIWTRQEIAFTVTSDYLNVLRTKELVYAADSTIAEANAQLALVQGQYQAGVVPIGQVYTQESVVGQDSLALIQANANFLNAKVTILYDLNVPPDQFSLYSFNADGIDTSTSSEARQAVDTTIHPDAISAAIDRRPDIIAQQGSIQAAEYQIDETRGLLYPSLNASVGIAGASNNPNFSQLHMNNALDLGLSLNIPIFDRMQNRLLIDEEEVEVENDRITLEQDVQQMRNSAAMAVNNLRAAEEALNASDYTLKAALESFRLAEERLRVGAGTEVDVVIAEAALETARTNRVNAKYNWVLAQRQLAYTLGTWNY